MWKTFYKQRLKKRMCYLVTESLKNLENKRKIGKEPVDGIYFAML